MKKSECWMTFSQALLQFHEARESLKEGNLDDYDTRYQAERLRDACEHLDAWIDNSLINK